MRSPAVLAFVFSFAFIPKFVHASPFEEQAVIQPLISAILPMDPEAKAAWIGWWDEALVFAGIDPEAFDGYFFAKKVSPTGRSARRRASASGQNPLPLELGAPTRSLYARLGFKTHITAEWLKAGLDKREGMSPIEMNHTPFLARDPRSPHELYLIFTEYVHGPIPPTLPALRQHGPSWIYEFFAVSQKGDIEEFLLVRHVQSVPTALDLELHLSKRGLQKLSPMPVRWVPKLLRKGGWDSFSLPRLRLALYGDIVHVRHTDGRTHLGKDRARIEESLRDFGFERDTSDMTEHYYVKLHEANPHGGGGRRGPTSLRRAS